MANKKTTKKKVEKEQKTKRSVEIFVLGNEEIVGSDLYKRARKIGITDAQLKSLGTVENIRAHCDAVDPKSNPDARVKPDIQPPAPKPEPKKLPEIVKMHGDNMRDERMTIESVHRKLNIEFNTPGIKQITKTVIYDCEKREIVTAEYKVEL